MASMTDRMKALFENVRVAVLATATPDGIPNAVPVATKKIIDDQTLLISDQFLGKTLENIKANPRVALTIWEGREGYQIKGNVTIETQGRRFEENAVWIEEKSSGTGFPLKSKGILIIRITEIYGVAPGPGAGRRLA